MFSSVVVGIPLEHRIVDDRVSLNNSSVRTIFPDDRRPVQVDLVVDDKQWVVSIDNIVVDTDTIQVLLEQVLEELVLLL